MPVIDTVPTAPKALPLLGHSLPLLRDPQKFLGSLAPVGDLVRIRVGPIGMVVVCDADLTQRVLRDDRTFDKGGVLFDRVREVLGNGPGSCPYQGHRRLRRLLQPAFHGARLPAYAEVMSDHVEEVVDSWRDGQVVDVPGEIMRATNRILMTAVFSDTLPDETLEQMIGDVGVVFEGFYRQMFMPEWLTRLPVPGNRSFLKAKERLTTTTHEIIARRRASGADHGDLLSALVSARDAESANERLSDDEISDAVISFLFAGGESSATVVAWALHALGQNPEAQRLLHEEVDQVLAGRTATYDDVPRLEYTDRVVKETLRLYSPGWFLTRKSTADATLGEHRIPAGTTIAYSPYIVHRSAEHFTRPAAFDPGRWDASDGRRLPPRQAMVPFGSGARKCIGDKFATVEAVITLATIVARWKPEPVPNVKVRAAIGSVMTPRRLPMRLAARKVAAR
ncbi:cytochrome P450 [Nocardiopsis sediminis]|uniref:Cytochrome P450 n=1 Tax=Nocardiopsis sediminis TaxID=1778267 RepID=A0ABV8FQ01_9ACTN